MPEIVIDAACAPAARRVARPAPAPAGRLARAGTPAYYLARLERDRPDLAAKVAVGGLSVYAASISAGMRKAPTKSKWASIDAYASAEPVAA
jgi:hypothetical protein